MKGSGLKLASVLALCVWLWSPTYAQAIEPIKLVYGEALSGIFQDVGERSVKGAELAIKAINKQGGLLGREVKLFVFDHEFKMDITTRKATKYLLEEKAKYFMGGTGSPIANAMSAFGEKNKVLVFTYMWPPQSLTGPKCHRYFFRPSASTNMQSYALAHWVNMKRFKKVYCIAQDWNFGKEATEAFINKLNEINPSIKIVGQILHKPGEKEYAPYVSQAIAAKPDVIFTPNWGNDLRLVIKQGLSLGVKVPWATYFLGDVNTITAIGNDDGLIGSVAAEDYQLTIPTEENKKFREEFYKEYGFYPTWTDGKAYNTVLYWAEAVKAAGKDDQEAVINAWEGLKFKGVSGEIYMRPCDHQGLRPVWLAEIVKKSPFFNHAHVGEPMMVPYKDIDTPIEKTGCKRCR